MVSSAQARITLTAGCAACRIEFDTIAVFGDDEGPGIIESEYNSVAVDTAGRFVVLSETMVDLKIFGSDGSFVRRLGGRGEGPGEFLFARAIQVSEDGRLFVLDGLLSRITTYDRNFSRESTLRLEGLRPGFYVLTLPGDSILLTGIAAAAGRAEAPIHLLSPTGTWVRGFGRPATPNPSSDPGLQERALVMGASGDLWVAGWQQYLIEQWSVSGERIRTLAYDPPWFSPLPALPNGRVPPGPLLTSIQEDTAGRLWLRSTVPTVDGLSGELRYDTVVEVVDPADGQVLASTRLEGILGPLFGDRMISVTVVDLDLATVRIVVLQANLIMN
jgi:hypothetical protein